MKQRVSPENDLDEAAAQAPSTPPRYSQRINSNQGLTDANRTRANTVQTNVSNTTVPASAITTKDEYDEEESLEGANIGTLINFLSDNLTDLLKNKAKMKRFEQITAEVVKNHNDPALDRVVNAHGWSGRRYLRIHQAALDIQSYLRSLANLFLAQRSNYDGLRLNAAEDSTESEKIVSFLPDVLINHLTSALVIDNSADISCSAFYGAALLVDISGFSMFAAEKCSHGVSGLNDLHDATNGFLGDLVKIVYRYGGDVVAFAGDALICVFVDISLDYCGLSNDIHELQDTSKDISISSPSKGNGESNNVNSPVRSAKRPRQSHAHMPLNDITSIDEFYASSDDESQKEVLAKRRATQKQAMSILRQESREASKSDIVVNDPEVSPSKGLASLKSDEMDIVYPGYAEADQPIDIINPMKAASIESSTSLSETPLIIGMTASESYQIKQAIIQPNGNESTHFDPSMSFNSPIKFRPPDHHNSHVSASNKQPDPCSITRFFNDNHMNNPLSRSVSKKGVTDIVSPSRKVSSEEPTSIRSIQSNRTSKNSSSEPVAVNLTDTFNDNQKPKGSTLYLDKLEESRSENNATPTAVSEKGNEPIQHNSSDPLEPDPYLQKNCCLRAMECAMLLKEQNAHFGTLTTHIAVSYGEMKLAILGGHNDDWVYLLNGECISELGACLNAAGKKQVVATKKCYEYGLQGLGLEASLESTAYSNVYSATASNIFSPIKTMDPKNGVVEDKFMQEQVEQPLSPIGSVSKPKQGSSPERIPRPSTKIPSTIMIGGGFGSTFSSPSASRRQSGDEFVAVSTNSSVVSLSTTTETMVTGPGYSNVQNIAQSSSTSGHDLSNPKAANDTSFNTFTSSNENNENTMPTKDSVISTNGNSISIQSAPQQTANPMTISSINFTVNQSQNVNRFSVPKKKQRRPMIKSTEINGNFLIESIDSKMIPAKHPYRLKKLLNKSPPTVVDAAKLFVSRPVLSAIYSDSLNRTAELRQVVTMFVSLDSYSPADHKDPLELQSFFKVVQEALHQSGGYLRQFVVDDKGCVVVAMWGVPQFSYSNNSLRGLFCGVAISKRSLHLKLKTSVGLTSGYCYCGCVGGTFRRDYAIIGDQVNMAARLMAKAHGKVLMDGMLREDLPPNVQHQLGRAEVMTLKGARAPVQPYVYTGEDIPVSDVLEDHEGQTTVLRRQVRLMLSAQLDKVSNNVSNLVNQAKLSGNISLKSYRNQSQSKSVSGLETATPKNTTAHHNAIATVIIGLPGTGKSTAAQYFEQEARKRNIDCIKIQARPGDESRPYSIIRKLFLELVGNGHFREEWKQRRIIREVILEAYGNATEEERITAELTLEIILGLEWSDAFKAQHENDDIGVFSSAYGGDNTNSTTNDVSLSPDFMDTSTSKPSVSNLADTDISYYGEDELSTSHPPGDSFITSPVPYNQRQQRKKLRLKVGDMTFYNVLKGQLKMKKVVIIIEDADYCDELSWNEFHLFLTGNDLQLAMLLTMRTPPSSRNSRGDFADLRHRHDNKSASSSSLGFQKTMSSFNLFQGQGNNNVTAASTHPLDDLPKVTITRASGEVVVVSIAEFDTHSSNPDINATKFGIKFRPNNSYLSILSHSRCKVIEMNPLNEAEINELLHEALQIDEVDADLVMSVLEVTAGNAFWCKAIARFIRENGIEEYSRTIVRRGGNFNSLRALILNRVDRLSAEQQIVAKHASIIGDEFTLSVLKSILPPKIQSHLHQSLEALEQNGLVYCVEDGQDIIFSFQNQLIRNTIYDLTPPTDADIVHLNVAELIEFQNQYSEDGLRQFYPSLSYHYRNSVRDNPGKKSKALKYTVKAADQAISRGSYPDGLAFLQLAIPFAESLDDHRTLLEVVRTSLNDLAPSRLTDFKNTLSRVRNSFAQYNNTQVEAAEATRQNIQYQYEKLQRELYKAIDKIEARQGDEDTNGPGENDPIKAGVRRKFGNHGDNGGFRDILGCMGSGQRSAVPALVQELSYVGRNTKNKKANKGCIIM